MKKLLFALAFFGLVSTAHAQTASTYLLKDSAGTSLNMGVYTLAGRTIPQSISSDTAGSPLSGAAGTSHGTAAFIQGVTGGTDVSVSFSSPQHFICDSGCSGGSGGGGTSSNFSAAFPAAGTAAGMSQGGNMVPLTGTAGSLNVQCSNCSGSAISVPFAGAIGSVGTPNGYKDGSGNFQPILGDVTNGQWVSIKASVALAVTGTFFQATQPISAASLPLPTGASTSALQTTGNTSLSSIDGKTPALGQALAASSVPVVLTAAQITTLTPPTTVTVTQGTAANLNATVTGSVSITGTATISGTVTANAGTNLNTSALALETGGNLAQLVTDFGAPGATACTTDTASCNLNQQMQRNNQRLTTINTTLGTPFQAGGSIGNTSFAATQATASSLNATVVGTGTFAVQAAQSGTWNVTNISGTVSLPTGAATAANQTSVIGTVAGGTAATNSLLTGGQFNSTPITVTNAQQAALQVDANGYLKVNVVVGGGGTGGTASTFGATFPSVGTAVGMSQGGNMVAMTGTSGNLNVQCANCSGSGASATDAATFTAGTSVFAPTGGEFTSGGATACVTGHQCLSAMTADRALFVNVADINGVTVLTGTGAVGTGAQRIAVGTDTATIAGSAPGTAGTASSNVLSIQGIASMTPVQVSQATAANLNATVVGTGTFATQAAQSGTWNITNISGTVSLPTGASTSALQPTNAAIASATAAQTGHLMMGAVTTAAPTYTTAQTNPLSLTTAGALRVDGSGVTQPVSLTSTTITGTVAVTQSGSWSLAANQSVNVAQINGVTPLMGNGVTGTGSQRVTIASDNTAFAVNATLQASATTAIGKVDPNTIGTWGLQVSTQNSATPTNGGLVLGQFNTTPTTITSGNVSPIQMDSAGNVLVNVKAGGAGGGAVTGGTASSVAMQSAAVANGNGTTLTVTGYQTALVNVNCSVACSGGTTINFEGTDSTGTFFSLAAFPVTGSTAAVSTATTSGQFWVPVSGLTTIRARISAYSAGTITVTGTPVFGVNASIAQVANATGLGQQTMAASSPVVIASNQSAITVNNATAANFNATVVGTGTLAVQATLQASATTAIGKVDPNTIGLWGLAASTQNGTTPTNMMLMAGQFNTSPTTVTSGNVTPFQVDNTGRLIVNCASGCGGSGGTSSAFGSAFPASGTAIGLTNGTNMVAWSATSNYGTAPSAIAVPAVNAAVTNSVTIGTNAALVAGSAIIGKVGIDQTTPGTTNGVQDAATSATAAAPPSKASYMGANASGATGGQMRGLINCDNHIFKHITTATDTLAVQGVASQTIYVCGWRSRAAGTATWFLENTASANANCSSTLTQINGVASEIANSGDVTYNPIWGGLKNTSGNGLCINSTGTGGVDIDVWYTQF